MGKKYAKHYLLHAYASQATYILVKNITS